MVDGRPGLDGGPRPHASGGDLHLGLGEVVVGFDDLRHPLAAHPHDVADLGHAHEMIRHASIVERLYTVVKG